MSWPPASPTRPRWPRWPTSRAACGTRWPQAPAESAATAAIRRGTRPAGVNGGRAGYRTSVRPDNGGGDMTDPQNPAAKETSEWVTGDEPLTAAQDSYLHTLAREAGVEVPDG